MHRSHLIAVLGVLAVTLAACERETSGKQDFASTARASMLDARLEAAENRIARLERQDEILPYKLSDSGFGFIETNTGGGTFQWIGSKDRGNGVALTVKLGNPSSAAWNKFTIIGRQGKLKADGEPDESSSKPFMVDVDTTIPAGSWKTITIQLDGPKAQDVGYLYVRSISISGIGLST